MRKAMIHRIYVGNNLKVAPSYFTWFLRTVSSHKIQDETGATSGNWVAGLSTLFPIFCEPVRCDNARSFLAAIRLIHCKTQIAKQVR